MNNWLDSTFSPNGKKLFFVVIFVLVAAIAVFGYSFINSKGNVVPQENNNFEIEVPNQDYEEVDSKKSENEVDILIEDEPEDKLVSVTFENVGRADPFLPDGEGYVAVRETSYAGYSLMAPPDNIYEDSEASRVVKTKVSGILYDAINPSAILNIEGNDYLVRVGDYINNYKVLSISKDLVTVQLGKNVYKAGVGQLMTDITLNYNTVYNLQNRFGGAKK